MSSKKKTAKKTAKQNSVDVSTYTLNLKSVADKAVAKMVKDSIDDYLYDAVRDAMDKHFNSKETKAHLQKQVADAIAPAIKERLPKLIADNVKNAYLNFDGCY